MPVDGGAAATNAPADMTATDVAADDSSTYKQDDLIGAAEGIFGKGAQGLAGLIEDILKEQGEPNAYIVGREAGGALVFGRSEERGVGKEWVRTCRSRWSPYP